MAIIKDYDYDLLLPIIHNVYSLSRQVNEVAWESKLYHVTNHRTIMATLLFLFAYPRSRLFFVFSTYFSYTVHHE